MTVFVQFITSNYRSFGCSIIYKDIFSQRIDTSNNAYHKPPHSLVRTIYLAIISSNGNLFKKKWASGLENIADSLPITTHLE